MPRKGLEYIFLRLDAKDKTASPRRLECRLCVQRSDGDGSLAANWPSGSHRELVPSSPAHV
jgi:hypothetical protein